MKHSNFPFKFLEIIRTTTTIHDKYDCLISFRISKLNFCQFMLIHRVTVTFIRANGERITTKAKIGDHLLDVVVNNNIDLDGFGACEGTLTCSTCHLIFKQEDFDRLPEKAGDEELDMLDLAYDLTDTSRLGCQITLTKELDGLEVKVPTTINDARS